ncbi:hypothetical protein [uncultured Roseobacter sp.]|uniref:hypothetical protein n=1 Tax=uncultured Roseobacter sp. TaxID=114847 RepID=UPI002607B42B|nr:hypothetical protein [uncultured Roseobacter sp.]
MSISRFVTALCFSIWAASGQAASITWTFDIELENSGSAVGSFVWDSEANSVTAWNISVSEGLASANSGPLPGQTFSSASAGHEVNAYTQNSGYSFLNFETDDQTYWFGPDRPRHFRLGFGYSGFGALDTPVTELELIGDTLSMFSAAPTGVLDCGACSPSRNGRPGSVISAEPTPDLTPVPLPGALPLALMGIATFGALRGRSRRAQA